MPLNNTPVFVATPKTPTAVIAAANTARDGSGVLVDLYTAPAGGTRVDRVDFRSAQATAAANSAMVGRLFMTDTSGANPRLVDEVAITAVTASNTAIGAAFTISYSGVGGLFLLEGQKLQVAQSIYAGVQDQMHVRASLGDYA